MTIGMDAVARTSSEIAFQLGSSPERDGGRVLSALVTSVHNDTSFTGQQLSWKLSSATCRSISYRRRRAALEKI